MKNKIIYLAAALGALLAACNNEDDGNPAPSYTDVDWFRLEPSDDAVDNLRYEIYKQYGVSIYYNDTIGEQLRGYTLAGEPIIHKEVLAPYYWIEYETPGGQKFTMIRNRLYFAGGDKSQARQGVEFLRDEVLVRLPENLRPVSFMMADSLVRNFSDLRAQHEYYTHLGITTTVLGRLHMIGSMAASERKLHAGRVMAAQVLGKLTRDGDMETRFAAFFEAQDAIPGKTGIWSTLIGSNSSYGTAVLAATARWDAYGFLTYSRDNLVYFRYENGTVNYDITPFNLENKLTGYYTPSRTQDFYDFAAEVFAGDDAAFAAKHAGKTVVLKKYNALKPLLAAYLDAQD